MIKSGPHSIVSKPFRLERHSWKTRRAVRRAGWQDDLPRIVDNIPRRLKGGSGTLLDYGRQGQDALQYVLKQVGACCWTLSIGCLLCQSNEAEAEAEAEAEVRNFSTSD